jgi:very-short-patch-repair endonuclease
VETDGWQAHGHRLAFEDDRMRDADLQALGYAVMRFTWRHVLEDPRDVTSRIGRVLKLRRAARTPPPPRR